MIDRGKRNVLGVLVDAIDYDGAADRVLAAAREQRPLVLTALAVHGVMTGVQDRAHGARLNSFDVVTPDGQPVRWALNLLHRTGLRDRVYGPELMLRLCRRAAEDGIGVYLYGSAPPVIERLRANLLRAFPALRIVGWESPPFRPLTAEEDAETVARLRASGARVVFIGLGCPRQDEFAHAHRDLVDAVLICVGAAFDFHAGTKRMAPAWMQRRGLEWLFRLAAEPRRLWRRYAVTNGIFLARLSRELIRSRLA
jgi:N-acetylglucosaminyldiphosphoundecaprenol N-acetyl-beta-D-mannosaminyltransferase